MDAENFLIPTNYSGIEKEWKYPPIVGKTPLNTKDDIFEYNIFSCNHQQYKYCKRFMGQRNIHWDSLINIVPCVIS